MNKIFKRMAVILLAAGLTACIEHNSNAKPHKNTPENSINHEIEALNQQFGDADFADNLEQKNEILKQLNLFLDKNPNHIQGLALRVRIYLHSGKLHAALNDVHQLNKLHPHGTQLMFECMLNEQLQRLNTEALTQCYQHAAFSFPDKSSHNINYQVAKYLSGDTQAKKNLQNINATSPNEIDKMISDMILQKPRIEFIHALLNQY